RCGSNRTMVRGLTWPVVQVQEGTMRAAPTRADALANRDRLLEAAHAVFRERGLGAEMKEIAQRAGVSVGTLYRNFPTREDLVAVRWARVVAKRPANAEAAAAGAEPVAALRCFLRGGFAIAERYGDLAVLHGVLPAALHDLVREVDMVGRAAVLVRRGLEA